MFLYAFQVYVVLAFATFSVKLAVPMARCLLAFLLLFNIVIILLGQGWAGGLVLPNMNLE